MKKTYQAPNTVAVTIGLQQMIAASNPEDGFSKTDVSKDLPTETISGNMSRRRSVWDDDDE